jgi:protein-tyrosine kinase
MGRIDEALRRSSEGVALATPAPTDQEPFVSAWTDTQPQTAAPVKAAAAAETRDSILVSETGARRPRLNPAWRERLASTTDCDRTFLAGFMRLAATLHKAQAVNSMRVLIVTSPDPSEGKTLTAVNLALVLSDSYKRRVLLVDADLRRPSLAEMTGVSRTMGLTEALKAGADQKLTVIPLTPTLTLLPGGAPDPDPISGLTSERMRRILHDAAAQFDWVILDAPPVGPIADAHLLAEMADGVLLVVRAGRTQYAATQHAIETIGRDRLLGVVLNGVERDSLQRGTYYRYSLNGRDTPRT